MSTPLIPAAAAAATTPPSKPRAETRLSDWLREPLLHFLLLGAALFGADHLFNGKADDGRLIVMDAAVDREARDTFQTARGRAPDAKELEALHQVWLSNEVLYREGLALQLDKGDAGIRERVIFKALNVVESGLQLPPHDDKLLRDWFEARRAKYDEPSRYDFQEAVLAADASGPDEQAVRAFVAALNSGSASGDAKAGLRVFKGRPHDNIVQGYGEDFAKALESGPAGEWRALPSRDGWRAVRLDALQAAKPAQYEALRGVVLQDWTDQVMAEQRSAAIKALAKKYTIRHEAAQ